MAEIVVIDSEPTVRTVVTAILESAGHSVMTTGEFNEALDMLRAGTPDLVLTNVFLEGIAGHDAIDRLREEFPQLQILMVSGLPDEHIINKWREESKFDVFPKPFTSDSLLEKVGELLKIGAG